MIFFRYLLLLFFFIHSFNGGAQLAKVQGKGTSFFEWGYSKNSYFSGNLVHTTGVDQTITYTDFSIVDQSVTPKVALVPSTAFSTQFHAQFGFYFRNKYALSLAIDQMKFVVNQKNVNLPFVYNQLNGVLFPKLTFVRTDKWSGSYDQIWTLLFNYSVGVGPLFSSTNYISGDNKNEKVFSMSGLGITIQTGPRFVWRQRFYLSPSVAISYLHQSRVAISSAIDEFMSQKIGVVSAQVVGGFYLHKRKSGGCMTCPEW